MSAKSQLPIGQWIMDRETRQIFKILRVGDVAVEIFELFDDETGEPRVVNRILLEREFAEHRFVLDPKGVIA